MLVRDISITNVPVFQMNRLLRTQRVSPVPSTITGCPKGYVDCGTCLCTPKANCKTGCAAAVAPASVNDSLSYAAGQLCSLKPFPSVSNCGFPLQAWWQRRCFKRRLCESAGATECCHVCSLCALEPECWCRRVLPHGWERVCRSGYRCCHEGAGATSCFNRCQCMGGVRVCGCRGYRWCATSEVCSLRLQKVLRFGVHAGTTEFLHVLTASIEELHVLWSKDAVTLEVSTVCALEPVDGFC